MVKVSSYAGIDESSRLNYYASQLLSFFRSHDLCQIRILGLLSISHLWVKNGVELECNESLELWRRPNRTALCHPNGLLSELRMMGGWPHLKRDENKVGVWPWPNRGLPYAVPLQCVLRRYSLGWS